MQDILDGYAAAATADFIAAYDGLSPESVYEHVVDLFPRHPARIAEIGAGMGRHAAWFARQGHEVLAVEPVQKLREAGRALHAAEKISWLDDRLPHLATLSRQASFDLMILCAVWQHLPDEDRAVAIARLAGIVAPDGLLIMSLRDGPGAQGRRVFPISPDMTVDMAQVSGLCLVRRRDARSV